MKNVKVYSTPSCPFCKRVKQYLSDNGVEFQDIDVTADQEMVKEMVEKSGQMGVPVVDVEGDIVVGFDRDKIASALGIE